MVSYNQKKLSVTPLYPAPFLQKGFLTNKSGTGPTNPYNLQETGERTNAI